MPAAGFLRFRPGRLRTVKASTWVGNYVRSAPATTVIIAICVVAWVVTAIQSHSIGASFFGSSLADAWTLWGPYVEQDAWRLTSVLTSQFMHMTFSHLFVNMLMLLFVGREVERYLGTPVFIGAYIAGGIASSGAILTMSFTSATIGASGALYSLLVLLIAVYRARGLSLKAPLIFIAINVAYTLFGSMGVEEISLWGHLGGLIGGLVMLPFIWNRKYAGWGVVLVLLLAGATIGFVIHPAWG